MAKKTPTADKPKHWTPRLAVIRKRNKEFLSHSRAKCKAGDFIHVTGHVFLEQEALLRYIDVLHGQMLQAGLPIDRSDFAATTISQDLEPDAKPEAGDDLDDEDDGDDPEA